MPALHDFGKRVPGASMNYIYKLKHKLTKRIRTYETDFRCYETDDISFQDDETVVQSLYSAIECTWPQSAYIILKAMYWTLTHPHTTDGWWREADLLIYVLNVKREDRPGAYEEWAAEYGESSAASLFDENRELAQCWNREVQTWPNEEWDLVREWLFLAKDWQVVRSFGTWAHDRAVEYWSQRAEDGGLSL